MTGKQITGNSMSIKRALEIGRHAETAIGNQDDIGRRFDVSGSGVGIAVNVLRGEAEGRRRPPHD